MQLTTLEKELSAPIAKKLFNNRDYLANEYREKGSLSLDSIMKVLGKPPIIPSSPDMDTMLEAYEERAEYGRLCKIIEAKIEEYSLAQ